MKTQRATFGSFPSQHHPFSTASAVLSGDREPRCASKLHEPFCLDPGRTNRSGSDTLNNFEVQGPPLKESVISLGVDAAGAAPATATAPAADTTTTTAVLMLAQADHPQAGAAVRAQGFRIFLWLQQYI